MSSGERFEDHVEATFGEALTWEEVLTLAMSHIVTSYVHDREVAEKLAERCTKWSLSKGIDLQALEDKLTSALTPGLVYIFFVFLNNRLNLIPESYHGLFANESPKPWEVVDFFLKQEQLGREEFPEIIK